MGRAKRNHLELAVPSQWLPRPVLTRAAPGAPLRGAAAPCAYHAWGTRGGYARTTWGTRLRVRVPLWPRGYSGVRILGCGTGCTTWLCGPRVCFQDTSASVGRHKLHLVHTSEDFQRTTRKGTGGSGCTTGHAHALGMQGGATQGLWVPFWRCAILVPCQPLCGQSWRKIGFSKGKMRFANE